MAPVRNSSVCFFVVFIMILQIVISMPPKYDTKIWEGEGGTVRVQEATKEYARTEKERASAAEAGRTKARAASVEQYPATVVNYPVVASVPVPVPVYSKKTYSMYPRGIYGQEVGQYGQGLGQFGEALGQYGLGSYGALGNYGLGNGPYYSKSYTPNYGYGLGLGQGFGYN